MEHLNALEMAFPTLTPEEQHMYWLKIHRLHGIFRNIVKNTPNANKTWTNADDDKIIEFYSCGKTFQEIAKEIGRTAWAVESRLGKLKFRGRQVSETREPVT